MSGRAALWIVSTDTENTSAVCGPCCVWAVLCVDCVGIKLKVNKNCQIEETTRQQSGQAWFHCSTECTYHYVLCKEASH